VKFEKGYFISSDSQRTGCFIKNIDWGDSPKSFQYKLGINDVVQKGELENVVEFGIDSGATFVRAKVKIDYVLADETFLNSNRNPSWIEETMFLEVLVKGAASLYMYKQNHFRQFYYQKGDSVLDPLVTKRYYDEAGKLTTNFSYRQQLWNELKCSSLSLDYIGNLKYKEADLTEFFNRYNTCKDPNYEVNVKKKRKDALSLKITPGLSLSSLAARDFTQKIGNDRLSFRLGAELEYLAPFNKNKWGLVLEPTFQYYKFQLARTGLKYNISYWTIELPVGIRHYLFLRKELKLFANGLFILNMKNQQFKKEADITKMEIKTGSNAAFGIGLASRKLSGELRYSLKRDVITSYIKTTARFTNVSFVVGYKIFTR